MATVTATRAAAAFPAFKAVGSGILCAAYGSYDFAAEPARHDGAGRGGDDEALRTDHVTLPHRMAAPAGRRLDVAHRTHGQ